MKYLFDLSIIQIFSRFPWNLAGWLWRPETSHLGRKLSIFRKNALEKGKLGKLGKLCAVIAPESSAIAAPLLFLCVLTGIWSLDGLQGLGERRQYEESASKKHPFYTATSGAEPVQAAPEDEDAIGVPAAAAPNPPSFPRSSAPRSARESPGMARPDRGW